LKWSKLKRELTSMIMLTNVTNFIYHYRI
jgi:hypothetical protein